jgi:hypothetical protein
MRLNRLRQPVLFLVFVGLVWAQPVARVHHFHVLGDEAGAWPDVLRSIGLVAGQGGVYVVRAGEGAPGAQWFERAEQGAIVILEGENEAAEMFGFKQGVKRVAVRNVEDVHAPKLPVIWQKMLELPVWTVPEQARVFARERWTGAPLIAGFRKGAGAVLWVAVEPGVQGYERFPYLAHALIDLGLRVPFHSARLWAFFDSSYRLRADPDYLARQWRKAGIAALHVAAWHFHEPDAARGKYLDALIEACHKQAILVYAWIELPHVSEQFWLDHPEWREKTALGQDAHLDWRKLMNLANPDCARAVAGGLRRMLGAHDWDGVNLAELYFESLQGHANPSRFTPMNTDIRDEFRKAGGFDPAELFDAASPNHHAKNAAGLKAFLDYRATLARRMQEKWIAEIEAMRAAKPHLDLVLTHVDDRFDNRMRDLIGADAASLLPMLDRHDFTFLIEDPATVWHLGAKRYQQIAASYAPLTPHTSKLAIDINIVERYQDVYPTKQQTGIELFQLVNLASRSFSRVALYFENSILSADLPLVSAAGATPNRVEWLGGKMVVDSTRGVGIEWMGGAKVDGRMWPVSDGTLVWLPAGAHAIEPVDAAPPLRLMALNANLRSAGATARSIEFAYQSQARALALVDKHPRVIEVDGEAAKIEVREAGGAFLLFLPRGQHLVSIQP